MTEIHHQRILLLARTDERTDALLKALKREKYVPQFTTSLAAVPGLLAKLLPGVFVHDWMATDPMQGTALHRRLDKHAANAGVCRLILAEQVTPEVTGVVADCGVRQIICSSTVPGLVTQIKMAHVALRNTSKLVMLVHKYRSGAGYDQAEVDACVDAAFKHFPNDPAVVVEYGNLCLRRGKVAQARSFAERLLADNRQNVRAMHLLGRILMLEDVDKAVAVLKAANVLSPLNGERLLLLADALLKKGDARQAGEFYEQAMFVDPENKKASRGLARAKITIGDVNAALELFRDSASEEEAVSFFNNAAVFAARDGKAELAAALYKASLVLAKSPRFKATVNYNLSIAYDKIGCFDDALAHATTAVELAPDHEKAMRQKARLESLIASRRAS